MPPKPAKSQPKVVYPSGVKEITDDLGTDELIRRLKTCAQAFQNMGQDDNNSDFVPLAIHLAQELFLDHSNKDVRLLVACCVADVFRVYAPEAPYKDPDHLKNIFLFFIKQLRGLQDPKDPAFKRYFYLLENLAWVKSFNICIELEDNQDIFVQLFTLMFSIVNDEHSVKVKGFMLDMMAPLISEADSVSQELLDVILANIIEPRKSQNRNAYNLARDLLKKTASTIEPYITAFFNNALILGKTSESDVATHLYELIYELNSISSTVLLAVLPQLEFKLKSNEAKERLDVTRLLARMFSDKNSELAVQHKALWACFLGRFNDINVLVRNRCVQYSMHFLLNHPELRTDITEQLKQRQHDPEETVRYEVVMAIITAAKRDFSSISDELLNFVKERTLDKKFKIRKEALVGLSMIFKNCMINPDIPESTRVCVSWIKNKVLHVYYQTALEDRLLVERILHTCLVPYTLEPQERMKRLYQLYTTIDEHAVKAFNELLKCQNAVRNHVRGLLEMHNQEHREETEKAMTQKIAVLAKSLPEPVKAQEFLKKFNTLLISDQKTRSHLETIMRPDCLCKDAGENVRELLKKLGHPVMTNVFYMTVKQLMERVAPVMIDQLTIRSLLLYVQQANSKLDCVFEELLLPIAFQRGLQLLHTLSYVFPGSFCFPDVYQKLLIFFAIHDDYAAETTLQIFINIGADIEKIDPETASVLTEVVTTFTKSGTSKQAKYAVRCLNIILDAKETHFGKIIQDLKQHLTLDSPYFRTCMISLGHIAYLFPDHFANEMKAIISKLIVKELIMQDKYDGINDVDEEWCPESDLTEETKAKIEGIKLMVRWIISLKTNLSSGNSTLKLFVSLIESGGDLFKKGLIRKAEMAWLRVTAACGVLKIVQEQIYHETIYGDHFMIIAKMLNDETFQVRERFAQKLHKGLISMKLPLSFLAIFAFGVKESEKDLHTQIKQYLLANINKRRDYLKQQVIPSNKLPNYLPEYVLPYVIHMLANSPDYKKHDDVATLTELKECLWFLMEPLVMKNESYSFSFVKKLLENIKQTKDALHQKDEIQNLKLYAICDLALGLVMSKTANFGLKELPIEPTFLAKQLFTDIDKSVINNKIHLPREMAMMFPKSLTIDLNEQKSKTPAGSTNVMPSVASTSATVQSSITPGIKRGRGRPPNNPHQRGKRLVVASEQAPELTTSTPLLEDEESGDHPSAKRAREETIIETSDLVIESGQMGDDEIQVLYPHPQIEFELTDEHESGVPHILIQTKDGQAEITLEEFQTIQEENEVTAQLSIIKEQELQKETEVVAEEQIQAMDTQQTIEGIDQVEEVSQTLVPAVAAVSDAQSEKDEKSDDSAAIEKEVGSPVIPSNVQSGTESENKDSENKTTRASDVAETKSSNETAVTRGLQRQSRKQVLTTRQEVKASKPEKSIPASVVEKPSSPSVSSKGSTTSKDSTIPSSVTSKIFSSTPSSASSSKSPSAPASAESATKPATRRVLRRDNVSISNGGRTTRSRTGDADKKVEEEVEEEKAEPAAAAAAAAVASAEESSKDSLPRKTTRAQTRASEAAAAATASTSTATTTTTTMKSTTSSTSKPNLKKPALRKNR